MKKIFAVVLFVVGALFVGKLALQASPENTANASVDIQILPPNSKPNPAQSYGHDSFSRKRDDQTVNMIHMAAEEGVPEAQYNLGLMYANGDEVQHDDAAALKWITKAAEQGLDKAQAYLAVMYHEGDGVAQNYKKAAHWYRQAADEGVTQAQFNIALMYFKGQGVPQDYTRAYFWFNLAASGGLQRAAKARDKVAEHLTKGALLDAQKRTREWEPRPD